MPDLTVSRAANDVADWIELTAVCHGRAVGSAALRDAARAVALGDNDLALGLRTMAHRRELAGATYPFRFAGGGVAAKRAAPASAWVALLLCTSALRASTGVVVRDTALHLEQLTAAALASFFGDGTDVVRFAWPSDEGRPAEFPDAVRWLADRMGVPIGNAYRPPYRKDGGVDVVAWRSFADRRSGFPVVLTQCTVERSYEHKAGDIDLRVWSGWLRLDVDPLTALALPNVVPAGEAWARLSTRTVVLDRLRLCGLIGASPSPRAQAALQWSVDTVARLRSAR